MAYVAVLGFGVVGSGTVEALFKNSDKITYGAGQDVRVKYILDIRDFPDSPYCDLFIKDFETIIGDPDVTVVIETIGGVGAAFEFSRRALEAGKSVVTSNKELVATHGHSLLTLAAEKGVDYLFEASVGGGIPIIKPLAQCLAANRIGEIYGILNGTSNYILTEMEKNGAALSDALLDAQKKGYAEADPRDDIEGHDSCRKLCILCSLAFGRHVYPEYVPAEGITSVTSEDMRLASALGYRIKLLVRVRALGDKISAYVAPHLVSKENLLASVDGVMNGVVVRGNIVGDVLFYGAGAGKLPTASAVTADIIDAVNRPGVRKLTAWGEGGADTTADPDQLESAWYIRTEAQRDKVTREFGEVVFADEASDSAIAFKTAVMSGMKVREQLDRGVRALSIFRVLGDY